MNHIGTAITSALSANRLTISKAAQIIGIAQSTLSRTIEGRRVDVSILSAICTRFPRPKDGLEILVAHLRDEVDRAGRLQTEVIIQADTDCPEEDIRLLAEEAQNDPDLMALLHDLACMVRRYNNKVQYRVVEREEPQAAEDPKKNEETPNKRLEQKN